MSFRTRTAAYFNYLMQPGPKSGWDRTALRILEWLSVLYRIGVNCNCLSYQNHPERQVRLGAKVISVGNITVGGTGKTPAVCMIARRLYATGVRVAVLNRGYRSQREQDTSVMSDGSHVFLSAREGGDEACLMARILLGIPVLVGRDRARSGRIAIDDFQSQVLILDDGFQHWQLHRDLDIVLIDGTNPFGSGNVLPRGILREPLEHLNRADLFIITKTDQTDRITIDHIYEVLRCYNASAPIAEAIHKPAWCVPFAQWHCMEAADRTPRYFPKGQEAIAVSALGNPDSFEHTIQTFGCQLVGSIRYDDHYSYTEADVAAMADKAAAADAILITTEKDAVKLPAAYIEDCRLPLYVLGIEMDIVKGNDGIEKILQDILGG